MSIADKLTYLDGTKTLFRTFLQDSGEYIDDSVTFREYVSRLKNTERTLGLDFTCDTYDIASPHIRKDLLDILDFARATEATYINQLGKFAVAAPNEPRYKFSRRGLNTSSDTIDLATLEPYLVFQVNLERTNNFQVGDCVVATDSSDLGKYFTGVVVDKTSTDITMHIRKVFGTGSVSSWIILKSEGLLMEDQATNIIRESEDFDALVWTKNAMSTSVNMIAAPDGTLTADKLVESNLGAAHFIAQSSTNRTGINTTSIYAKAGERKWLRVTGANAASKSAVWFNVETGTIGSITGSYPTTATIEPVNDGWYRCSVTVTGDEDIVIFALADNDLVTSYIGDGTSGLYVWGAQLEEGSLATSYIPTESTTVTRSSEDLSRIVGDEWRNDEGTLYADFEFKDLRPNYNIIGGFDSWAIRTAKVSEDTFRFRLRSPNPEGSMQTVSSDKPLGKYKVAVTWKDYTARVSINGDPIETVTSTALVNETLVGFFSRGVLSEVGNLRKAKFFPKTFTDEELQEITS